MAKIRTCMVDGKQYTYCPHCGKDNPNETWRFLYCSDGCKDIDYVLSDYRTKKINIASAYEKLSSMSLPSDNSMTKYVVNEIREIMAYKPSFTSEPTYSYKKKNRKNNKNVVENKIVNDDLTEEKIDVDSILDSITSENFSL